MTCCVENKTVRVICIGNRYVDIDSLGPQVYDCLKQRPSPGGIEVVEGGLAGLNLLGLVENARRVVFVDSVSGFGNNGSVMVLNHKEIAESSDAGYGHSGGLGYLLKILPSVCEGALPEIFVVGTEGPADEIMVGRVADICLEVARQGHGVAGLSGESRK